MVDDVGVSLQISLPVHLTEVGEGESRQHVQLQDVNGEPQEPALCRAVRREGGEKRMHLAHQVREGRLAKDGSVVQ